MAPSTPQPPQRFLPGAMIAGRYRVVALLGRGGMGEVYRADDTKLGEAVALKFLPESLEHDDGLRERFLGEARLARQVAHPNICRVYDIGEAGGRPFLSMEYIDGEDLATLLRRIGRLPEDKAVQIAHELCAGLQAAHARGIVHRDLKPSNVMLDGRGHARITDFGLAILESAADAGDLAGTPAYMAPEQQRGEEVTARTDVYALGLVLHELFTGRPAIAREAITDPHRRRTESSPERIASSLSGLDPAVARAIAHCLREEPRERPASATAVALALPGGDPLAAALAAGETPSPEMVAGAGGVERFAPAHAWGWLAGAIVALALVFALAPRIYLLQRVPIEKPPAVLVDRARDIARTLGRSDPAKYESATLLYDDRPGKWFEQRFGPNETIARLKRYSSDTFTLLYRRSPHPLVPVQPNLALVGMSDPALDVPGMLSIRVDGSGRLHSFEAVPPQLDSTSAGSASVDWAPIFALAGLDTARFTRVAPQWSPRTYADERLAWLGSAPGESTLSMRIEAASYHGRPIGFRRVLAWTRSADDPAAVGGWGAWAVIVAFLGVLVLSVIMGRRNVRAGRADPRGALRLGIACAAISFVGQWAGAQLAADPQWILARVLRTGGRASLFGLITTALYLTLEPVVRRTWPHGLVSWIRLLEGRWRDRRLGRDVLAGIALGLGLTLVLMTVSVAGTMFGRSILPSDFLDSPAQQTDALLGTSAALSQLLVSLTSALQSALLGTALIALLTLLTKRRVLALVLSGLAMMFINGTGSGATGVMATAGLFAMLIAIFIHFGFVAIVVAATVYGMTGVIPLVLPGTSWYWSTTAVALLVIGALAAFAMTAMLRGERGVRAAALPAGGAPGRLPTPAPRTPSVAELSAAATEASPRPAAPGEE
jgi:serine/threonine-protein kinase